MGLYAAVLFYLSSLPHPSVPRFRFSDKLIHLAFYAGFGAVVAWACDPERRLWSGRKIVLVTMLAAFLYGAADEFHQVFVSNRTAEMADLAFDTLGGILGGFFYSIITYASRSRRKGKTEGSGPAPASL